MKPPIALAGLLTALTLAFPTAAVADTLNIVPPSGPKAGSDITVTVSGSAEGTNESVRLYMLPSASACPLHWTEALVLDESYFLASTGPFSAGPFSSTVKGYVSTPGPYLLCGYLGLFAQMEVVASAAMTVGPSIQEETEARAREEAQAREREEQAKHAAEEKAREVAAQAPASILRVKVVAHREKSSHHPGYTTIWLERALSPTSQ